MDAQPRPADLTTKALVREWVWNEMERQGIARFPTPCHGRIPTFDGAKSVADTLGTMDAYLEAEAVFVGPDLVLKACRDRVLRDGKILAFSTPGNAEFKQYGPETPRKDTSVRGLKRYGDPLKTPVSVIILGSVAVDLKGNRIGTGSGDGDREIIWLRDRGVSVEGAVRMTPVHPIQFFDDLSPLVEKMDEPVDWVILPDRVVRLG